MTYDKLEKFVTLDEVVKDLGRTDWSFPGFDNPKRGVEGLKQSSEERRRILGLLNRYKALNLTHNDGVNFSLRLAPTDGAIVMLQ